ncbi:hypothetical protein DH2020_045918 [Rehmannia glutinosa]|uniref:Trichome birefringence-like N-terminal domain-containing protein n=1 Tax=Rehmannia glutinosa TaxID=99300 RepID=A0ABR0UCQ1_REHGL
MSLLTWNITRLKSHYLAALFLVTLITAVLYLTVDNESILEERKTGHEEQKTYEEDQSNIARQNSVSRCDFFSGTWVYDNISYPLYKEKQCSFMLDSFACEKYGRKDLKYQHWRWQPHDCDLPRFNGTALLEKIRGKKLVFVGDSLNKNQWTSMLCLIESSVHQSTPKLVIQNGNLFTFQATVRQLYSFHIVESNSDHPVSHGLGERIIRITAIEKHARHWSDADILIFDSFVWWVQETTMTLLGESWKKENCYNETEPIFKEGYWGIATDREMMNLAESTIQKLQKRGLKVDYLNITHLSDLRKDAHSSIHRKFPRTISEEQLANPTSYADCTHWCLPRVPDVWNQILYSYIMNS